MLPLPPPSERGGPSDGERVLAGFRPEGARVLAVGDASARAAGAAFVARVEVVERAGHERLWHLTRRRAALRRAPAAGGERGSRATPSA